MFLIDVDVRASAIPNAGLGVFVREAVAAGTPIWLLHPLLDRVFGNHDEFVAACPDRAMYDRCWDKAYPSKYSSIISTYALCGTSSRSRHTMY